MDHDDSDRARFRLHVGVIVDEYGVDNDEQRTENLLLARKLASALAWKRGRLALLDKLQDLETSDESRTVVQALFLIPELATAATGRNCSGTVLDRECQLTYYPVQPPNPYGLDTVIASLDDEGNARNLSALVADNVLTPDDPSETTVYESTRPPVDSVDDDEDSASDRESTDGVQGADQQNET